jgi:hypothetical protein
MADGNTVVHIGENSPEHVAHRLMQEVASLEGKLLYGGKPNSADRKWLLDTYAECLRAARGFRKFD